jgi:hypothetical protein
MTLATPGQQETLRKTRELLDRLKERQRIRRRDDRRDAIARRVMQGLVVLFVIYAGYAVLNCTVDRQCPAHPTFRALLG